MKKIFFIFLFLGSLSLNAQKLNADLYAGIANYQGDLQGRVSFSNAHFAGGLGLAYNATPHWNVRLAFMMSKLSGSDQTNPNAIGVNYRNLNFNTAIKEFQLALEYNLFDLEVRSITPYVFGGVALMKFNPYTEISGTKVYLKPLGTEGQGMPEYPDKKEYSLSQFAIPFGGGLKVVLTPNLQIHAELGLRKLFTDYLDDVSTTYADSALLANFRGPLAAELAYRGDEVHGPGYPAAGSQRGNPKNNDSYYITTIRIRYLLNNNNGSSGRGRKSRVGCPTNVY